MNLDEFRVRCPSCRSGGLVQSSLAQPRCEDCGTGYSADEGFLDLIPQWNVRRTAAQALMEWPPLIRIYEGRLWRRSPAVALVTQISFEREYSLIAEAAGLGPEQAVLDLACGPGIYSRRFARVLSGGTVVGLDLSIPMLRYAARRGTEEELENLLFVHGDAMELPFEAGRFDVVNCCGALHLFPDVEGVLGEIQRVLKPGGRLTLAAFRRGESALAQRRAKLRRRLYGLHSFTPGELSSLCTSAGLLANECLHARGNWVIMSATKSPPREGVTEERG